MSGHSSVGLHGVTVRTMIFLAALIAQMVLPALIDGAPGPPTKDEQRAATDVEAPATFKRARLHVVPPVVANVAGEPPPIARVDLATMHRLGRAFTRGAQITAESARLMRLIVSGDDEGELLAYLNDESLTPPQRPLAPVLRFVPRANGGPPTPDAPQGAIHPETGQAGD